MRKQDIKPGVVYAYQQNKDYDAPVPIVFLNTPTDGPLYSKPRRYGSSTGPVFRQTGETKPRRFRSYTGNSVGYPAVKARNPWVTPDLSGYTLAGFEAATSHSPGEDVKFVIITSLALITGTYEDACAEWEARQEAEKAQRERDNERKAENNRRVDAVLDVFEAAGVTSAYSSAHQITLSLADAEKLAALLATVRGLSPATAPEVEAAAGRTVR